MGSQSLAGMLEYGTQEQALYWHLTSNHYPPLNAGLVPVAQKAIDNANKGKWGAFVGLKKLCSYKGRSTAPTSTIIKEWHLEQFLTEV